MNSILLTKLRKEFCRNNACTSEQRYGDSVDKPPSQNHLNLVIVIQVIGINRSITKLHDSDSKKPRKVWIEQADISFDSGGTPSTSGSSSRKGPTRLEEVIWRISYLVLHLRDMVQPVVLRVLYFGWQA